MRFGDGPSGRGARDGMVKRWLVGSRDVFSCHRLMKFPPSTVVVVVARTGYYVKLFSSPKTPTKKKII